MQGFPDMVSSLTGHFVADRVLTLVRPREQETGSGWQPVKLH